MRGFFDDIDWIFETAINHTWGGRPWYEKLVEKNGESRLFVKIGNLENYGGLDG